MKIRPQLAVAAFSLTEMMIAMALFTMVIGGVVYSQMVGMKMYEITKAKLGASDQARAAISLLVTEVRAAKIVRIGTGGLNSFSASAEGQPHRGNALQVYATTETNKFVRYFWDPSDRKLKRTKDGTTSTDIIAEFITNDVVFASEDFAGNVLTNGQNNRVISLTLQFYQIQYPVTRIGPGQFYDFYQLRTRITRRTLE